MGLSKDEVFGLVKLWFLIATVAGQGRDETILPGESGTEVTETAIARISDSNIFPPDNGFLRRIAWVESKDGTDPNTYRLGYDGGIWQVDLIGFLDTQNVNSHPGLTSKFAEIRTKFNIDWPSVTWNDLRKPLYSALAARLFLSNIAGPIPNSADVAGQAGYWKQYYNTDDGDGTEEKFINDVSAIPQSCNVVGVDMVFVMDGSGSVGSNNFELSKQFVGNVAGGFTYGPGGTRVGVIQYSSSTRDEFGLTVHTTRQATLDAIGRISYRGGGTQTGSAISRMVTLFGEGGVRPNIPRIGIVITDGMSFDNVEVEADAARAVGITMFAIGVGNADLAELNQIANDPDDMFRFEVGNFGIIGNIQRLIGSATCRVPVEVTDNNPVMELLPPQTVRYLSYNIPPIRQVTIKINSPRGQIICYLSYRIRNPSAAFYDWKLETTATRRFVQLFIDFNNLVSVGKRKKRQLNPNNAMILYGTIENKSPNTGTNPGPEDTADINVTIDQGNTLVPTTPVPNLSPCDPNTPCANSGTCLPNQAIPGGYYCQCSGCYIGDRCEIDTACVNNGCQNGGQCSSFADSCDRYYCSCPPCFYGQFCQNRIDVCSNHKCQNGAMCVNQGTCRDYQCACSGCYTGAFCEIALPNPCSGTVPLCQNGGACAPIPRYCYAYQCQCINGYDGRNCEIAPTTNLNACNDFPCSNGGTCVSQHDGTYDCICPPGFNGPDCTTVSSQVLPSVCDQALCLNGGTCYESYKNNVLVPNQYTCVCAPGWAGIGCSTPTAAAAPPMQCNTGPYICRNGGICGYAYLNVMQKTMPLCRCPVGYIGQLCEIQYLNPCSSNPCRNNAACSAFNKYFVCQCLTGYTGVTCNDIVAPTGCASSPCVNGNCFQITSAVFFCRCVSGFSGTNCDIAVNPCSSAPCRNNGACLSANNAYTCQCLPGYTGPTCDLAADTTPPIITGCPDNMRMIVQPGQASTSVSWIEPMATDPSGIKSTDALYPGTSMLTLSPGAAIQVEYKFTDNFDNEATCSFVVSVSASTGLRVMNCNQNNMRIVLPSNALSVPVSWTEPTSTIGVPPSYQSYRPGDLFQEGVNVVTYRFGTVPVVTVCSFIVDVVGPVYTCTPGICQNGGTCLVTSAGLTCTCSPGFSGSNCQSRPNQCAPNPCLNGGNCFSSSQDGAMYFCDCPSGYSGANCEMTPTGTSPCTPNPCLNGGNCLIGPGNSGYVCSCPSGFSGNTCQIDLRPTSPIAIPNCPPRASAVVGTSAAQRVPVSWTPPTAISTVSPPLPVTLLFSTVGSRTSLDILPGADNIETVVYIFMDSAGNQATCAFAAYVSVMSGPPISSCPSNIEVNASPVSGSTVVTWQEPTSAGSSVTATSGMPSGSAFPPGYHPVYYMFGQRGVNPSVCAFIVTVNSRAPAAGKKKRDIYPHDDNHHRLDHDFNSTNDQQGLTQSDAEDNAVSEDLPAMPPGVAFLLIALSLAIVFIAFGLIIMVPMFRNRKRSAERKTGFQAAGGHNKEIDISY